MSIMIQITATKYGTISESKIVHPLILFAPKLFEMEPFALNTLFS